MTPTLQHANKLKYLLLILIFSVIFSCDKRHSDSTFTFDIINNTSSDLYFIGIKTINNELNEEIITFTDNQIMITKGSRFSKVRPTPITYDSLIVIYNDTVRVTHSPYLDTKYTLEKNIYLENSWEKINQDDNLFQELYIFNEASFQEALKINGY